MNLQSYLRNLEFYKPHLRKTLMRWKLIKLIWSNFKPRLNVVIRSLPVWLVKQFVGRLKLTLLISRTVTLLETQLYHRHS